MCQKGTCLPLQLTGDRARVGLYSKGEKKNDEAPLAMQSAAEMENGGGGAKHKVSRKEGKYRGVCSTASQALMGWQRKEGL